MLAASIPAKFNIPFANSAGGSFIRPIPEASQIGIQPGAASLTDGFPPLNFTPIASGGVPPYGEDMNGLLNQSTAWDRWFSAGGPVNYDGTFSAAVGGYPLGAVVASNVVLGNYWLSTVDGNTTDPDAGGAGWINPPGMMGTGHWQHRPVSTSIVGWIISNGTTIGDAASGATQLASASAKFAFAYLWSNFSNTQCPVSGGRGANAAADFAAHKTIATFNMQATGVIGVDGMGGTPTGLLTNVPVVNGSVTLAGSILGENLHTLITAELASHSHVFTGTGATITVTSTSGSVAFIVGSTTTGGGGFGLNTVAGNFVGSQGNYTPAGTNAAAGSGTGHNNVMRVVGVYWFMKL